jgi:hypothetical protein
MLLKNWRDGPKNDCANFLPNVPQLHMSTGIAKHFFKRVSLCVAKHFFSIIDYRTVVEPTTTTTTTTTTNGNVKLNRNYREESTDCYDDDDEPTIYYFGIGSNMLRSKVESRGVNGTKIELLDMEPAYDKNYRLAFNMKGFPPLELGMGVSHLWRRNESKPNC